MRCCLKSLSYRLLGLGLAFILLGSCANGHDHDHDHDHGHGHAHAHGQNHEPHYHQQGASFANNPQYHEAPPASLHHIHLHPGATVLSEYFAKYLTDDLLTWNTCAFLLAVVPVSITLFFPSSLPSGIERLLVSFAAGTLLGDVFLHALPHLAQDSMRKAGITHETHPGHHHHHHHHHHHGSGSSQVPWISLLIGYLGFFLLQRLMFLCTGHSCQSHTSSPSHSDAHRKSSPYTGTGPTRQQQASSSTHATTGSSLAFLQLFASLIHTFSNGVLLSLAFVQGVIPGCSTFLALMVHEIAHRLTDYTLLQTAGGASRTFARRAQVALTFSTFAGSQLAKYIPTEWMDYVMPFAHGGLMYIATATILPSLISSHTRGFRGWIFLFLESVAMTAGIRLMQKLA